MQSGQVEPEFKSWLVVVSRQYSHFCLWWRLDFLCIAELSAVAHGTDPAVKASMLAACTPNLAEFIGISAGNCFRLWISDICLQKLPHIKAPRATKTRQFPHSKAGFCLLNALQ